MSGQERLRADLGDAVRHAGRGLPVADQLCDACVSLMPVDGAAISLLHEGSTRGTFGSSGQLSRRLDELQFTFGEGPCYDAVRGAAPVLVDDLSAGLVRRWPAFAPAVLAQGVHAVYALPIMISSSAIGALDLFRFEPGPLADDVLSGGLLAAELAALPLLDLMTADVDWSTAGEGGDGWSQLASLERVEVYQATGMVMAQLDVGPTEALVLLRARAFTMGVTASELAFDIIERRVSLADAGPPGSASPGGGRT